jgi:hypothetical protein
VPVPGLPRNRFGETPDRFHRGPVRAVNQLGETPDRFDDVPHVAVSVSGESPGTMTRDRSARVAAYGTVRRLWRQAVNMIPAPPPFRVAQEPALITRALRYRVSTRYAPAGADNTRFGARRPIVEHQTASAPVTIAAGQKQSRPTVRNRLTSFGSRVPPIVAASLDAQADPS